MQAYPLGSRAGCWNAHFLAVSQTSTKISYAQILRRQFICLSLITISNILENISFTEKAANGKNSTMMHSDVKYTADWMMHGWGAM